ncbi:MAG: endonuclease III [Chloroflexi bacterium]|nr:MAG: endonuclease III [Chloroflexota bacterium]
MTNPKPAPKTAEYITELIHRLRQAYPDAHCELNYETPFQLLVAVILSAQCTDVRVNQVTPHLFARYPTPEAMAAAPRAEIEAIIRPTGFFRQKARYIQETAHRIIHEHGGTVPDQMKELLKLPGVARKTANVVLGEIYNHAEGITVDTHVKRLAKRLALTDEDDPGKVEQDLMKLIPAESWIEISHLLIFHGRRVCKARNPECAHCFLNDLCPSAVV